jgi:hypothetical protein
MLRSLSRLFRSPAGKSQWQVVPFRPRLEALEDRVVPTITITGSGSSGMTPLPLNGVLASDTGKTSQIQQVFTTWVVGTPVNLTLTITSDSGPFTVAAGSLHVPDGVTVSGGGSNLTNTGGRDLFFNQSTFTLTISGTPTDQGDGGGFALIDPEAFNTKDDASLDIQPSINLPQAPISFSPGTVTASGTYKSTVAETEGVSNTVTITANASSGPTPTMTALNPNFTLAGVSIVVSGNTVTFSGAPNLGTAGVYTLSFEAANGVGDNIDVVTLSVGAAPPVVKDASATTPPSTAVLIQPLTNDSDPDGGTLTLTGVGTAAHGSVQKINNAIVYTPANNFLVGTDQFTYTASTSEGGSASANVLVTVAPVQTKWTGAGNGNWNDPTDWTNGIPKTGENLVFPSGAKSLNSTDNMPNLSVNDIEIDDNYFLYRANAAILNVTGNITVNSGNVSCYLHQINLSGSTNTITVAQNATFTLEIETTLSGGQLIKAGAGGLDFAPTSNYAGPKITLQAGNLGLSGGNNLGSAVVVINGTAPMAITRAPGPAGIITISNELDLVLGTLAFPSGSWTLTGKVVVSGYTELDAVNTGGVTLKGSVTTVPPPAGNPPIFLTVGGAPATPTTQKSFVLGGSLDANTTVIVKKPTNVNLGAGLSGPGTIIVGGTLISDTGNSFAGKVFLEDGCTLQLVDTQALGTAALLGTAQVTDFAELNSPATIQTVQQGLALLGSTSLSNTVVLDGSNGTQPAAGLTVNGSLTLSGAFTLNTSCELTLAANTLLTLKGKIGPPISGRGAYGADLTVGGTGKLFLGGNLDLESEVAVLTGATVQLVRGFTGNGTLVVNGGTLLSNTITTFGPVPANAPTSAGEGGTITLMRGTIQVGAQDALGTALLVIDAAAAPTTAPVATLQGDATLDNDVNIASTSGPLGIGSGSQLTLFGRFSLLGFPTTATQFFLTGNTSTATQLTLESVAGDSVEVGGGAGSELYLSSENSAVVRATAGGTVRLGPRYDVGAGGRVEAVRGGTIVVNSLTGQPVKFTNQTAGATLQAPLAIEPPGLSGAPAGVVFPVGFFSFTMLGVPPGQTATVSVTLPTGTTANGFYALGQQPTSVKAAANTVTLTYKADADGSVQAKGAPTGPIPPPPAKPSKADQLKAAFSALWAKLSGK